MAWSLLRASLYISGVEVTDGCELMLGERVHTTGGAYGAKKHSAVRSDYSREEHCVKAAACTSFKSSWSIWLLVCMCFCSESVHCAASIALLHFCGLCFHQITSTHTTLPSLAFPSPGRKKHLDVKMDWFAALCTGFRNITGFSESVKYLWERVLTVCYYIEKENKENVIIL